ncbi:MAG: DUF2934 domain-containing protein [Gammaproteobacteria bacterium]|nr:DUF2934 domain-containing protein [Gammaproteobacteria bacterium]
MAKVKGNNRSKSAPAPTIRPTAGLSPGVRPDLESSVTSIATETRQKMIQEAAYFRAVARGFQGGDPIDDWLAAEAEINRTLPRPSS